MALTVTSTEYNKQTTLYGIDSIGEMKDHDVPHYARMYELLSYSMYNTLLMYGASVELFSLEEISEHIGEHGYSLGVVNEESPSKVQVGLLAIMETQGEFVRYFMDGYTLLLMQSMTNGATLPEELIDVNYIHKPILA